ncbi:hypothetical protein IBX65_06315 [Candidatus Aerophobetes bacterium]|nr:hypothetical protein [Candidatus Aerophobetes bacterium]
MHVFTLLKVVGGAAFILLVATFLFGFFGWNFSAHFWLAIMTLVVAIVHGGLAFSTRTLAHKRK